MPRAFLITNRRYNSIVDYDDYSWSRDSSLEREVSTAEGPLFIDDSEDDSKDVDDSYKSSSPKSSGHESNEPSSSSEDSRAFETTDDSDTSHSTTSAASTVPVIPYTTLSTTQQQQQHASTITPTQPCVISCCYTNADLVAVIQQLMKQNPTLKRFGTSSSPQSIRPKIHKNEKVSMVAAAAAAACDNSHACPECGKKYSTSSNLARHRQTHRSVTDKKARKCPHCEKIYVSMPAYSMHVRTHSQGCQCPYCGKCFSRAWLLTGHIRTHTGEKPFSCNVCHKAFADKSNLRAHIQTHSNSKPYLCERCGKAFALKSYLYKHEESSCMRTHKQQEKSSVAAGLAAGNVPPIVQVQ